MVFRKQRNYLDKTKMTEALGKTTTKRATKDDTKKK